MTNLVVDWTKNNRFEEFVELEKNVKSYVENNFPFITLERDNYHSNTSIVLEHYPYENIISSCVRFAISASDKAFHPLSPVIVEPLLRHFATRTPTQQ